MNLPPVLGIGTFKYMQAYPMCREAAFIIHLQVRQSNLTFAPRLPHPNIKENWNLGIKTTNNLIKQLHKCSHTALQSQVRIQGSLLFNSPKKGKNPLSRIKIIEPMLTPTSHMDIVSQELYQKLR